MIVCSVWSFEHKSVVEPFRYVGLPPELVFLQKKRFSSLFCCGGLQTPSERVPGGLSISHAEQRVGREFVACQSFWWAFEVPEAKTNLKPCLVWKVSLRTLWREPGTRSSVSHRNTAQYWKSLTTPERFRQQKRIGNKNLVFRTSVPSKTKNRPQKRVQREKLALEHSGEGLGHVHASRISIRLNIGNR